MSQNNGYQLPFVSPSEAPVKEPILDDGVNTSRVWLQWFSDISDANRGDFGPVYINNVTSTAIYDSLTITARQYGTVLYLILQFTNLTSVQGDTINLPNDFKFSAVKNVLTGYILGTVSSIINGTSIEDKTLILPDVSGKDVIISGFAIRKV